MFEMTLPNMRSHVQGLADAFDIHLIIDESLKCDQAMATFLVHPKLGRVPVVSAPPIQDETGYAVIMHELGHHLSPLGFVRRDLRMPVPHAGSHPRERHAWVTMQLEEEQAAWDWAQHYALWWTVAMESVRVVCFSTYETYRKQVR